MDTYHTVKEQVDAAIYANDYSRARREVINSDLSISLKEMLIQNIDNYHFRNVVVPKRRIENELYMSQLCNYKNHRSFGKSRWECSKCAWTH